MANNKNSGNKKKQNPKTTKPKDHRDKVILEFADGVEQECMVEGVFETESGHEYMAVAPTDGTGDIYIYKYKQLGKSKYSIEVETDEELFAQAVKEYEEIVDYQGEDD